MSTMTVPRVGRPPLALGVDAELDSIVMIYTECDYCTGLFPNEAIESHIRIGHAFTYSDDRCSKRRLFAVTELHERVTVKTEITKQLNGTLPVFDAVPSASGLESAEIDENAGVNESSGSDQDDFGSDLKPIQSRKRGGARRGAGRRGPYKKYKQRVSDAIPVRDRNCKYTLMDFPELPTSYDTELLATKPGPHGEPIDLLLKNKIENKDHIKDWLDDLAVKSGTNWLLTTNKLNRSSVSKLYATYFCRFSSVNNKTRKTFTRCKDLKCRARIAFNIRKDNCCVVKFGRNHTHEISVTEVGTRPVAKETAMQFELYFNAGMRPTAALSHHEKMLRSRDSFTEDILVDRAIMPTLGQVSWLFKKYIRDFCNGKAPSVQPVKPGSYDPRLEDEAMMADF